MVRTGHYAAGSRLYAAGRLKPVLSAYCLLLTLLTALPLLILPSGVLASDEIFVEKIVVEGLASCSKDELLSLMNIHQGPIYRKTITEGIKRVFRKGIFEDIIVNYQPNKTLLIEVREREFIDDIDVTGNTYLSDKEIKGLFILKEGEIMRYDLIERAKAALKESLGLIGFPQASVSLTVQKSHKPYRVEIELNVNEGEPLIIRRIDIIGAERWLKQEMNTEPGDIYNIEEVKEDLTRLRNYLKSEGYYNPIVGPFTFSKGVLTVSVTPGKKLTVEIKGNHAISDSKLLKLMPFSEAGEINNELIEEASAKIISLYHQQGYIYAQVAPVKTGNEETVLLTFFIYEGRKYMIKRIEFKNTSLSEESLKDVINLQEDGPYNPDLLEKDQENMISLYRALGYLNAKMADTTVEISEEEGTVNLTFTIHEGERAMIKNITVKGNSTFTEEEIGEILKININSPYNELDIIDAKRRLIDAYRERGFTDVRINTEIKISDHGAEVTFNVKEGEIQYFGKTIVRGNRDTRTEVIERELPYKEGLPLNYRLLPEVSKRLYRLGLFKDIDIRLLDRYDHKRDVLIEVRESNPGLIEFGFGYNEYEYLRGTVDISYRNLWGMNRRINLTGELSTLKERFLLGYHEPYLFGRPIVFNAFLLREARTEKSIDTKEVRYRVRKYSSEVSIEKNLSKDLKAQLAYNYSIVNTYDVNPDVVLSREDEGTLAISSIRPSILYDTRDNPFDPSRGVLAGASLKIASTYLLGETDFIKLTAHGSVYKSLGKRFVLALSLKGGFAQGFANTRELPIVERFFLGGRNTVRGFEQDSLGPKGKDGTPTGGNVFLLSNIELRTYIGRGFGFVGFIDAGNVWTKSENIDLTLRYTAGLGIRYKTPVGPIRIDYGYKLDRKEDESAGEIHFSISHAF